MDSKKYIVAIDLGTTSVRTLAYDVTTHEMLNIYKQKISQFYPHPGWVEQDAVEIVTAIVACLKKTISNLPENEIYGIGITNQRETIVAWDKNTGKPFHRAIVWQCRRTFDYCEQLKKDKRTADMIHRRTGLLVDSYFSATKIAWLLQNSERVASARASGKLCIGTLDSYLIYCLTNGEHFVTDHTNASRTLLYNIKTKNWDIELCRFFDIPIESLPRIINCDEYIGEFTLKGKKLRLGGLIGDQQSSLFGQNCIHAGDFKTTFGTGAFMLANIGSTPVLNKQLLTTVAWSTSAGINYALEGTMYSAGACINWLQDQLKLIETPADSERLAGSVVDTGGVFFVPALSGLGAPFWKGNARALFSGITLSTTSAHLIRAVLRGITYNTRAVFDYMRSSYPISDREMRVDGGMTANNLLMQFQSDIMHFPVNVSAVTESTALGACYMAGLCFGAFNDIESLTKLYQSKKIYKPTAHDTKRESNYQEWLKLIENFKF